MKPGDIYHASSGKIFKVVPDLAYIMNRENPRCIGCYFNDKKDQKDQKDPCTLSGCTPLLEQEGCLTREGGSIVTVTSFS